jgi:CBS domain-containing protein
MAQVSEIMTPNPVTLPAERSARDAAVAMNEHGVDHVIVLWDGKISGLVSDHDLVTRVMAKGLDAGNTPLIDVSSRDLVFVEPSDTLEHARQLLQARGLRRLPVVEKGRPVGTVTLGDLAATRQDDLSEWQASQPLPPVRNPAPSSASVRQAATGQVSLCGTLTHVVWSM